MKLIYIKSTMEPKNYSTIRSILKKEQGEKIAPYVFKMNDTKILEEYLDQEKITYEIYQEERVFKRVIESSNQESSKKRKIRELNSAIQLNVKIIIMNNINDKQIFLKNSQENIE